MKKVYVSDKTKMVLASLKNIDNNHALYDSFYEKEVEDDFHVHVFGDAIVYRNALVHGNVEVYGRAEVRDNALVYDYAEVYGNARVFGNAEATNKVINFIGLPYDITITDNHIVIGRKQFDFEAARKLAERNFDTDEDDYKEMIKYKDVLLELIKVKELENE